MAIVRAFFRFWYDFIIGDDWRIAAGVVAALALGGVLVASGAVEDAVIPPIVATAIVCVVGVSIVAGARRE